MKRFTTAIVVSLTAVGIAALAVAQPSGSQPGRMQQPPAAADRPGAHDHEAHHAQHMEMCRQMMGGGMGQGMIRDGMMGGMMRDGMMGPGMMGGGMMGMMGGGDPKQQAEMMAMRGEMMKAMGDILLKYAQRAQSAK